MDRAEQLIEELKAFGLVNGNTVYFCRRTALEIIDRCETMRLELAGIDGFYLTPRSTEQPLDWILDLSKAPGSYEVARRFIWEGKDLPLFYEFVISDPLHREP
jgi:hypothetical protein